MVFYPQAEFRKRISVLGGNKMGTTVEIARRGQITIPKNLREALGIEEGNKYGLRALEGAKRRCFASPNCSLSHWFSALSWASSWTNSRAVGSAPLWILWSRFTIFSDSIIPAGSLRLHRFLVLKRSFFQVLARI